MAIFPIHHPLAFTFGLLGNIVSFMVYLAPLLTFYRIYKKKSTQEFQSIPYVVALFSSMLWMYYAFVKSGAYLLITINCFGCIIETIYIAIFVTYAPNKARLLTAKLLLLLNFGGFSLIVFVTLMFAKGPLRVQVLGWICVACSVSVFAAPLSIVRLVIRTKSVEFMPFTLSFFLMLSAIMWFSYGFLLKDIYIALPNIIGFVFGVLQMVLYGIYKNKNNNNNEKDIEKEKLPQEIFDAMKLSTNLGECVIDVETLHSENNMDEDQHRVDEQIDRNPPHEIKLTEFVHEQIDCRNLAHEIKMSGFEAQAPAITV